MYIEVKNASLEYKGKQPFLALDNVNLEINKGEFICLLGQSGCGKTTLLNALAGFEKLTKGQILIDGKEVTGPKINNITIFQNYGLLPWRTVLKNVELGLEIQKVPRSERKAISLKCLEEVGLKDHIHKHPGELSGGQKQRVAIARALAVNPDIIFMDEPFGALDAVTRMKLQDDVRELCTKQGKTIIFVTHDIEEAVYLSDRIVVLEPNPGHIKSIVKVNMQGYRDRTSVDFIKARSKVFEIFNMKANDTIEYYI